MLRKLLEECFSVIISIVIVLVIKSDQTVFAKISTVTPSFEQNDMNIEISALKDSISVLAAEPMPPKLNLSRYPGEQCKRTCMPNDKRVCYFHFVLENYQAMGVACGKCAQGVESDCYKPQCIIGDGIERGVMSINRRIPGPDIQVCHGDYIVVDVANHAHGSAATIHWHGLHMRETPYMDGVPFVTQCPIPFATTFRYEFYATEPGTQFYHSHSGHHKVNGQYGALIVRQPLREDPMNLLYDFDLPEHHLLISDWMHVYGEDMFPGVPRGGIVPDSVLINGRGQYSPVGSSERTTVPPTIYYVEAGERYRFRLINGVSHACPFQLQIEKHDLMIIASDSFNVRPRVFDTLVSNSGERYDFVVNANHTEGDFWIRIRALGICQAQHTESFALLRYKKYKAGGEDDGDQIDDSTRPDMPAYEQQYPNDMTLNHPKASCFEHKDDYCITELTALEEDKDLRYATPDHKFFLAFQNYLMNNEELFENNQYNHFANIFDNFTIVGAINKLSLTFPDSPPLTQPKDIDESKLCHIDKWPEHCRTNKVLCPCVHVLPVKENSIVELIVVDESEFIGDMHHPFHLHGYRFMVTGLYRNNTGLPMTLNRVKRLDQSGNLRRLIDNPKPPFKDTVSIPNRGYAVVRFRATNPGFWIMHCHYEWHVAIGMGLILQVGPTNRMVKPPVGFPRCGNYLPTVRRPRF
uniref:Uncharacterized protein n=1 Tax=Glossina brevipalpis TaxID=37001 RepID=A0A1A9WAB1_9MUSC